MPSDNTWMWHDLIVKTVVYNQQSLINFKQQQSITRSSEHNLCRLLSCCTDEYNYCCHFILFYFREELIYCVWIISVVNLSDITYIWNAKHKFLIFILVVTVKLHGPAH
jgi:hypothetical protein